MLNIERKRKKKRAAFFVYINQSDSLTMIEELIKHVCLFDLIIILLPSLKKYSVKTNL